MNDLIVTAKNSPRVKAIKSPEVFSSEFLFFYVFCFVLFFWQEPGSYHAFEV